MITVPYSQHAWPEVRAFSYDETLLDQISFFFCYPVMCQDQKNKTYKHTIPVLYQMLGCI